MKPDDDLCLCFHVSLRKVVNWIRLNRPQRAGQISDCFGAGTGCGWCRTRLEALHARQLELEASGREDDGIVATDRLFPETEEYGSLRQEWIRAGKSARKGESGD